MKVGRFMKNNIFDISNYNIVGTLSNELTCSVWIASLKNDINPENLYIINRFQYNKYNLRFFKDFFSYYSKYKESQNKDISNFFASDQYFYIVFKYIKAENIANKYHTSRLTDSLEKRFQILYSILIKLDSISSLPLYAFLSVISLDNICIDDNENVQIVYNLDKVLSNDKYSSNKIVFVKIADIIRLMLSNELKNKYNSQIKIIVEKCEKQLFTSIPQLIIELKKIESTCTNGNFQNKISKLIKPVKSLFIKTFNTNFYKKHRKQIKKYSWICGSCLSLTLLIFLIFGATNINNKKIPIDSFSLGNTTYVYNQEQENPIENTISIPEKEEPEIPIDLSISADTDITFTDYIVQYGDTFDSICTNNYSSKDFISTIKSFNNLQADSQLIAGTLIKLPDETAVKTLLNIY